MRAEAFPGMRVHEHDWRALQASTGDRPPLQRLRVGFLSTEFIGMPTSYLTADMFHLFDKEKYEVFVYAASAHDNSHWRIKIEQHAEHVVDVVELDTYETLERVKQDKLHVFVDMDVGAATACVGVPLVCLFSACSAPPRLSVIMCSFVRVCILFCAAPPHLTINHMRSFVHCLPRPCKPTETVLVCSVLALRRHISRLTICIPLSIV
jgi:hypothetical protein